MPLQLQPVDLAVDFTELVECEWAAFETPYQPYFRLVAPIHGTGPTARADSLAQCAARQLAGVQRDSNARWIKAVDDEGKIVGAALWKTFSENPFAAKDGDARPPVSWYPEGPQRDYVTATLAMLDAPRKRMATRPHVCTYCLPRAIDSTCYGATRLTKIAALGLNILFTHPAHRRRGVADLLLSWGTDKADELGVEAWVNASDYGRQVYEKHGFVCVTEFSCCASTESPSQEWEEIKGRLTPMSVSIMWRPAGGKYEPGVTVKPWE